MTSLIVMPYDVDVVVIALMPRGMMNACSNAVRAVLSLENELKSELAMRSVGARLQTDVGIPPRLLIHTRALVQLDRDDTVSLC